MARKPSTKNLSLLEIQEMLDQKIAQERKKLPKLIAKRDSLQEELDEVNQTIETLGGEGAAPKKRRGRAAKKGPKKAAKKTAKKRGGRRGGGKGKGRVTLPEAIANVLSQSEAPMSPNEITSIIQKSKHPSAKSSSLRLQVTTALSKRPEFKRVGRGQYQFAK